MPQLDRTASLILQFNTMPTHQHPTGHMVSDPKDLLGLLDADFGALVIGNSARILGNTENGPQILGITHSLRLKQLPYGYASTSCTVPG